MNTRRVQKWQAFLLALVTGTISCSLTIVLFEVSPLLLLGVLMGFAIFQLFLFALALYHSRFWEQPLKNVSTIFGRSLTGLVIGILFLTNVWVLFISVQELWLQSFGTVTEAIIIDRQLVVSDSRNRPHRYYQITYSWKVTENGTEVKEYIGEMDTTSTGGASTSPGSSATVRYLPDRPTVYRLEEDFVRSPINEIGLSLFMNLYFIASILIYLWLEKAQLWKSRKSNKL